MAKETSFYVNLSKNNTFDEVLVELLQSLGVSASIEEKESFDRLNISYSREKLNAKQTRNAGRKPVECEGHYTLGEVLEMKKEKTIPEILYTLNISRTSYYRRLEMHKKEKHEKWEVF